MSVVNSNHFRRERCVRQAVIGWCIAAALAVGCKPAEEIQTYSVPKENGPRRVADAVASEPTDRMLAAILPDGEKAWFFKIVGPTAAIDAHADQIEEFFTSIRLAADEPHPRWQLPAGWVEQPGTGIRAATILVPTGNEPTELTVTSLSWSGTAADLLGNVNRWRDQMQLAPLGQDELADSSREVKVGGATMTIVDFRGRMQDSGMSPPFARGGAATPGSAAGDRSPSDSAAGLPPGHPPITASPAAGPAPLTFDTPEGWQPLPATGMRKAAFRVGEAEATVIDFPADAGPMIADPLENINRWRSEVGLTPISPEQLPESTEPVEISGRAGRFVAAIPDSSQPQAELGTLAAMVTIGDRIWFFKLTGNRDLVDTQREKFKTFLESVRIPAEGESSNGDQ